jgi:DNA polymerase III alpha subunit
MIPYAELHCRSHWSLLDGASSVEELVLRAKMLGYEALALTDHDGLYGAMEFAQTAKAFGVRPIIGAKLTLANGHHLTLLCETQEGYDNLCRLLLHADLNSPRGQAPSRVSCFSCLRTNLAWPTWSSSCRSMNATAVWRGPHPSSC